MYSFVKLVGSPPSAAVSSGTAIQCVLRAFLSCALPLATIAAWAQDDPADLADKKLEDLMNIEVTSASKTGQRLSETANAIFVITQEDIRNSGATNVPDLLRMVPGLDVAQINASNWAISARGLNSEFANELLVLVDGRSVYTPLTGGVYWNVQDFVLEDIDRIEVICGPGAAIWGSNAVNGVINIITKRAQDTHGALATAGGGSSDRILGEDRYGGSSGKLNYRISSTVREENSLVEPQGGSALDGWNLVHGGFRTDTDLSASDKLTVQGDLYEGQDGLTFGLLSLAPFGLGGSVATAINRAATFRGDGIINSHPAQTSRFLTITINWHGLETALARDARQTTSPFGVTFGGANGKTSLEALNIVTLPTAPQATRSPTSCPQTKRNLSQACFCKTVSR